MISITKLILEIKQLSPQFKKEVIEKCFNLSSDTFKWAVQDLNSGMTASNFVEEYSLDGEELKYYTLFFQLVKPNEFEVKYGLTNHEIGQYRYITTIKSEDRDDHDAIIFHKEQYNWITE